MRRRHQRARAGADASRVEFPDYHSVGAATQGTIRGERLQKHCHGRRRTALYSCGHDSLSCRNVCLHCILHAAACSSDLANNGQSPFRDITDVSVEYGVSEREMHALCAQPPHIGDVPWGLPARDRNYVPSS